MLNFNGILCQTIEQLEELIVGLSEDEKTYLRNDFNGVINPVIMGVPSEVTNQQLRQALILKSFNENKPELHPEAIKVFLSNLTEPTKSIALNFWEYSNMMQRKNATLNQLSPLLGLSSEDIDNLFIVAITL